MLWTIWCYLICSWICMVMSLKNCIYIILIYNRSKLCTKNDTIWIWMVITWTIYILMEHKYSPLCIRIFFCSFFYNIFMCRNIIVISINTYEKCVAICKVIICTSRCPVAAWLLVRIVKMIRIINWTWIVITDCCGNRKASKHWRIKETCIFYLLFKRICFLWKASWLVNLVTCWHNEA